MLQTMKQMQQNKSQRMQEWDGCSDCDEQKKWRRKEVARRLEVLNMEVLDEGGGWGK